MHRKKEVMHRAILLATALYAANCVGAHTRAMHASVSHPAHGRQLYIADGCYQCHGYSGQGSVGPRLAPDLIPLDIFARQLRNPIGVMPVYTSTILSDSDLADIYAYLNSIPKPTPVAKIPLLR
jgi:mono/diheme cytochrome c family protein